MSTTRSAAEPVVQATGLTKRFDELTAVDGIDFAVQRGECFGFLGPNGAGKTTTMRMIYGASPISAGSLKLLGLEAAGGSASREIKRVIGVIPQEDNLDHELTVTENLAVFCRFHGLHGAAGRERVTELLDFVQLSDKANAKVMMLSGGMKRRLMIARGLIGNPSIIVLDEPTTGLDPGARQNLWERLYDLRRRQVTLLLSTHYMDEAEQLCDRLVIMDRGKIVATGSPRELIAQHTLPHVVELRFDATAVSDDDTLPAAVKSLEEKAARSERLRHRLLLYTDDGEQLIAQAAHELPDVQALLRRATLEDVFLRITGRGLID
ncbi:MAG: ABC transporter ATP-binding protein [Planctomycetota bacterium]